MKTIHIKLLRDIKHTRSQVLAIVMVVAAGITTFVMSMSTYESLVLSRDSYYREYNYADIAASMVRAPESLRQRIESLTGVDKVETRIMASAKLTVEDFADPVTAQIISLPDYNEPSVNRLYIREGRLIDPGRDDEVILNEVFAEAHALKPGDKLEVIIKGRLKTINIVGIALSPEFIYQVAPGAIMPDNKRYAGMWMARNALNKVYDMDGAFNNVVLTTTADANIDNIIEEIDLLLERYGGQDAQGREWQVSHRIFQSDLDQLQQMATMFSTIFLGVAAFLLNIVVGRMIGSQREQIAALKSFGYSNIDVGLHYAGYVMVIVVLGLATGVISGVWLGRGLIDVYIEYYRLPVAEYEMQLRIFTVALLITTLSATVGTFFAVQRAVRIPPAEAMRPEPPANYKETFVERLGFKDWFSQPTRMIMRHIERKPVKAGLSVIGIAMACAIMVSGTFFQDAIKHMINIEYGLGQRQDVTVIFVEPTSHKAFYNLLSIPGVEYGETFRSVPVRLRNGHLTYRTAISGYEKQRDLFRTLSGDYEPIEIPDKGIALTDYLGGLLNIKPGDVLTVEVLEGRRPVLEIPVTSLVSQFIGVGAYMDIDTLNRAMHEGNAISGAVLRVDSAYIDSVNETLIDMPRVANSAMRMDVIDSFYETSAEFILIFVGFISMLAGIITFGVVYNSARIALAERSRELASMRVLGFTRGEISYILLGELTLLTLCAIPIGLLLGYQFCWYMLKEIPQDIFRLPLIIEPRTYALAASVVMIASLISSLIVRAKLDHLDLISVLKTKE